MQYQWLTGHELDILDPILQSNGWSSLNPNDTIARVAWDDERNGEPVGLFVLQRYPVLGPLWIDRKHRGNGVAEQLVTDMRQFIGEIRIRGAVVIADSIHTEVLCKQFGLKRVESPVYML